MRLFILCLILVSTACAFAQGYNEVTDEAGNPRPAYRGTAHYPVADAHAAQLLGSPLHDSIRILPVPLVLGRDEYSFIQAAAIQRARTLLALFKDVVFNKARKVGAAKLVPAGYWGFLSRESTQTDIDYLRRLWKDRQDKTVSLFYGGDLIRGPDGRFVVIEDNVGSIGGVGDLQATHEAMSTTGQVPKLEASPLAAQIESFLSDIPRERWATEVIAIMSTADTAITSTQLAPEDEESVRKARIVTGLGIPIIMPPQVNETAIPSTVKKIVNFYDPLDYRIEWNQKKLLNELFASNKVTFMVPPGIDWLGSKSLLKIMDQLTVLYLGETPLIATQPTDWITGEADIDFSADLVIKQAGEDQGRGVHLLGDLPAAQLTALGAHIRNWQFFGSKTLNAQWPFFVKQKKIIPSYIPAELPNSWVKFNVDIRPLVYATDRGPILKPALWGRANLNYPGSKNNVSINAMEMVVTAAGGCESLLR